MDSFDNFFTKPLVKLFPLLNIISFVCFLIAIVLIIVNPTFNLTPPYTQIISFTLLSFGFATLLFLHSPVVIIEAIYLLLRTNFAIPPIFSLTFNIIFIILALATYSFYLYLIFQRKRFGWILFLLGFFTSWLMVFNQVFSDLSSSLIFYLTEILILIFLLRSRKFYNL